MIRISVLACLMILSLWGSACTTTEPPAPLLPPSKPDAEIVQDVQRIKDAKIGAARYELQLYQEQLEATIKDINNFQDKAGTAGKGGELLVEQFKVLLSKRSTLEEKVIQSKVKLRELELLANEKH